MADIREKLIEILSVPIYPHLDADPAEVVADYLLDNGVTVQQWIPVSDSPKERGEYIVLEKHWVDGHLEVRKGRWNGVEWFVDGHESRLVAYWLLSLPLPEPPNEAGTETS